VQWLVEFLPEVVRGVESFGFSDVSADQIRASVEYYLGRHGEMFFADRWDKCPDDFFVYSHIFIDRGQYHALIFVVEDSHAEMAVLKVVWVEHHSGKPV
jgi:hypothetical protein